MDKYIIELLKVESTVIIPGLGALMNGATEGSFVFNKYLKINDHKLEEYISKSDGVDAQEAANSVAKLVREINARLDIGETYDIFGLGRFFKAEDGSIDFESWDQLKDQAPKKEESKDAHAPTKKEEPKKDEAAKESSKISKVADKSLDPSKEASKPKNVITPKKEEVKKEEPKAKEEEKKSEVKPKEEPKKETPKEEIKKEEPPKKQEPKSAIKPKAESSKTATNDKAKQAKEKAAEAKMKEAEAKKKKADDAKMAKAKAAEEKRKKIEEQKKKKEEARKNKLVAKKKKTATKKNGQKQEGEKEKSGNKGLKVFLIILVIIVAGGGAFTIFKWDMVKDLIGMEHSSDTQDDETTEEAEAPDAESSDDVNPDINTADSLNSEEDTTATNQDELVEEEPVKNEEVVEDDMKNEEPVVKEEPKVQQVTSSGSYHIIVGGFSDEGNAQRFVAELQGKGYPAQNLGRYGGLSLVSVKSYSDIQSAKSELSNFSEYNGAWIFKKK